MVAVKGDLVARILKIENQRIHTKANKADVEDRPPTEDKNKSQKHLSQWKHPVGTQQADHRHPQLPW